MVVVEVEDLGVAPAQGQAGVALPLVGEAVDPVQLDGAVAVDEMAEHARAPDGGELQRVAHQRQAPAPGVGQLRQLGQLGGRDHGRLVDHHRRPRGQVVAVVGGTVEAVLDQQLVEGVGGQAGLDGQDLGRPRRGGDAEHGPPVGPQLLHRRGHGRGLAGAGGADDEHQFPVAGHRPRHLQLGLGQGQAHLGRVQGDVAAGPCEPALGPGDEALLLGQDLGRGQGPVDDGLGDGAAVAAQGHAVGDGPGDVDQALGDDLLGQLVQPRHQDLGVDGDVGGHGRGQLPDQLRRPPARLGLGQGLDGPGDDQLPCRLVHGPAGGRLRHGGADDVLGVVADGGRPLGPLRVQRPGVVAVGLGRPALGHRLPLQAPALTGGGVSLEGLDEALELVLDALLHRLGARRELGQDVVGDAGHLGDAVDRLGPLHPQGAGQLGPQAGVVEGGQAPLVAT